MGSSRFSFFSMNNIKQIWFGAVRLAKVRLGMEWPGRLRCSLVWCGEVWSYRRWNSVSVANQKGIIWN
jgi:hypothetical protein